MRNILAVQEAIKQSEQLHQEGKTIVVAGGCFDIIHIGHIEFLQKAKKQGNALFVLLESDEKITSQKGKDRPINTQTTRARVISSLRFVDYVVLLPFICTNQGYDDIISKLNPAFIATTKGDPYREHKERQANLTGAKVVDVTQKVSNHSTSKIAKFLSEEL